MKNTANKIEVKYTLAEGLSGAGTYTESTYRCGPRNLVKAARAMHEIETRLKNAYGNIGFGSAWIEIGGAVIDKNDWEKLLPAHIELDIQDWKQASKYGYPERPASATGRAKEFLNSIGA